MPNAGLPEPHQARTRPQSDFGMERGRISDFGGEKWPRFSKPFAHFSAPKESGDEAVTSGFR